MSDYQIIELLCSAEKANVEQAEQICKAQKWKLKTILEKYGYAVLGFSKGKDFLKNKLEVRYKKIEKLPELLPAGLETINLLANELNALPEQLPPRLNSLFIQQNQVKKFPNSFPSSLKVINCSHNQLATVPFSLPTGLDTLNCGHNQLTELPELPATLQRLFCFNNQLTVLPELPPNLENLQCQDNQLSQFPAVLPPTLSFIDCSNNPNLKFDWLKNSNFKGIIKVENCPHFDPALLPEGFQLIEGNFWRKVS